MDGLLLVDKPRGPTSHDVVARARRALGTKAVGHAGTLDPMASGLLVLGIGEGTKLLAVLEGHDKRYETRLRLGRVTETLDEDGAVVEEAEVPAGLDVARVQAVADGFVGAGSQVAPAYSAIKQGGVPLYVRARRGEVVDAPVRPVFVHSVEVTRVEPDAVHLALHVDKGFYVRSFGRDLAVALGTVGYLDALRRTHVGRFSVDAAVPLDELVRGRGAELAARLISLEDACGSMPRLELDDSTALDLRHGRPATPSPLALEGVPDGGRVAGFLPTGELLALLVRDGERLRVARGFVSGQAAYDRAHPKEPLACEP